jgi:hypothetical protein
MDLTSFPINTLTWLVILTDDDDFDRRPQRRRYEEPLFAQVRRQLLTIAESVRALFFFFRRAHCALQTVDMN